MQPDDLTTLESKLRRGLMPVALSDSATDAIHAMLDELSGTDVIAAGVPFPAVEKTAPWRAAAAVLAGLLAISAWFAPSFLDSSTPRTASDTTLDLEDAAQNMQLVDESTHLAWVEDEGWLADPDGGALHAVRVRVVEENRLLDEETGIIVHVASPREEMLLMPVSTF